VTSTLAVPAMAVSRTVPILELVVIPHVPDWSPVPINSTRSKEEYALAIS